MAGRVVLPPAVEERKRGSLPVVSVNRLLDTLEKPLIVSDRSGTLLLLNARARQCLESQGLQELDESNLFSDVLKIEPLKIFGQIEKGEREVRMQIGPAERRTN